jgi:putative Flp pilus-assembly TadE/G-like protein
MLSARARERGQVVVVFALLIPVLFALAAVVLDVGNWFVHKRHLQTQVDAAALAAGPSFVGCFSDPPSANLGIASRALAYGGDTLRPGKLGPGLPDSTTNTQVQEPGDVRLVLNANRYWHPSDGKVPGTNGYGLDNTLDSADVDTFGDPCNERYLDVKATDEDAPPLWGLIPFTPSPKSHAKVEIHDIISARGMLPWAVPEIDPAAVVALFVDEDPVGAQPEVFKTQDLIKSSTGLPWSEWTTPVGQETVTLDGGHENTGIVILVSKNDTTPTLSGDLSDTCTQDPGLVACYGNPTGLTSGLSFIHGYNGGSMGTLQTPIVRGVELVAAGCPVGDNSAPYFTLSGGCSAGISAVVDFGVTGATNPTLWPNCVKVDSSPGGTMTWVGNVVGGSLFTSSMNLAPASGRNAVNLSWESEDRPGGPNNCNQTRWSGSFNKVAAPYVSDTASGPVQYLDLYATKQDGTPMPDPNSVELNDPGNPTYKYYVTVGLPKPLQIGNYTDPPLLLRMASPSGSQNQAWDCDSGRNFREEIETGCQTTYTENFRDDDGDGLYQWNNILCAGWGTTNLPPPTIGPGPSPYPSDCVITETGDKTGQLRDGLHDRLETPCYENNWPDDAAELADFLGPDGQSYASDPRYVTLIITDNTAFTGAGNEPLPIKYFAGFYVTGWDYHPSQSPGCPDIDGPGGPYKGNDDHPIFGPVGSYTHSQDNGDVWGYFVDIVVFSGAGDPSDNLCTFGGDPAACVAVLVE